MNQKPEVDALDGLSAIAEHESSIEKLHGALRKERTARSIAEREARDSGRKLDQITGDVEGAFEARAAALRAEHAAELKKLSDAVAAAKEAAGKARRAAFDSKVDAAARAAGCHNAAVGDALRAARERFQLDDDGELVALDGRGSVGEWLESMKADAPHWFRDRQRRQGIGHGARDAGGVISEGMFKSMSPKQRAAAMAAGYRVR